MTEKRSGENVRRDVRQDRDESQDLHVSSFGGASNTGSVALYLSTSALCFPVDERGRRQ